MDLKAIFEKQIHRVPLEALAGVNETFHLDIQDGGQFTLAVVDGKPSLEEGLLGTAGCTIKASKETLDGLMSGKIKPAFALMMGKIKISNLGLLMKYGKLLGIG